MDRSPQREIPAEFEKLARRVERFRKGGRRRRRLPDRVWASAVELARSHGVSRIARALRLDYYALKHRLTGGPAGRPAGGKSPTRHSRSGDGARSRRETASLSPKFVQIDVAPSPLPSGCTVELEDRAGRKMTMRVPGGTEVDLVTLARTFWRRWG